MKRDDLNAALNAPAAATCMACGSVVRVKPEYDATGLTFRIRKTCACAGGEDLRIGEPLASVEREVVRG